MVIFIEFDKLAYEEQRNLLYVGMAGARSLLTVFVGKKAKEYIDRVSGQ